MAKKHVLEFELVLQYDTILDLSNIEFDENELAYFVGSERKNNLPVGTQIYMLNQSGQLSAIIKCEHKVKSPPLLVGNSLYFATYDEKGNKVYAFDLQGNQLWEKDMKGYSIHKAVLDFYGNIILVTYDLTASVPACQLCSIKPSGEVNWIKNIDVAWTQPIILGENIYIGEGDGVAAFDVSGKRLWYHATGKCMLLQLIADQSNRYCHIPTSNDQMVMDVWTLDENGVVILKSPLPYQVAACSCNIVSDDIMFLISNFRTLCKINLINGDVVAQAGLYSVTTSAPQFFASNDLIVVSSHGRGNSHAELFDTDLKQLDSIKLLGELVCYKTNKKGSAIVITSDRNSSTSYIYRISIASSR